MTDIDEIKKALIENPNITDDELFSRFGIKETLVVAAVASIMCDDKEITEEELRKNFPELKRVKIRENFINWIADALRSIWKLGRRI